MSVEPRQLTSGFAGERMVRVSAGALAAVMRVHPLMRGLAVVSAGFFARAAGHESRRAAGVDEWVMLYCVRGSGWVEYGGRKQAVRRGGWVLLEAGRPHAYGSSQAEPWSLHWVHLVGSDVEGLVEGVFRGGGGVVREVGEDLQLVLLFTEVLHALQRGMDYSDLFLAASACRHLLAVVRSKVDGGRKDLGDSMAKVAGCIEYMSEHLDETLRVGRLAERAGISASHLGVLFRAATGVSPREYLRLLRMHQACCWLSGTGFQVKDIASRLGYRDAFHFSRAFKAFTGVSPTCYRGGVAGACR